MTDSTERAILEEYQEWRDNWQNQAPTIETFLAERDATLNRRRIERALEKLTEVNAFDYSSNNAARYFDLLEDIRDTLTAGRSMVEDRSISGPLSVRFVD